MIHTNKIGIKGEQLAAQFLLSKSYQILDRNRKYDFGEIDILAQEDDTIVVVEVKSGSATKYGLPLERVDRRKQEKLRLLADRMSQEFPGKVLRIDVINVDENHQIIHLESAVEAK